MLTSILEPTRLAVILFMAMLVVGPKRLPAAGRALGSGVSNFRQGLAHPDEVVGAEANATTSESVPGAINSFAHGSLLS